jgi:hypothetical protein
MDGRIGPADPECVPSVRATGQGQAIRLAGLGPSAGAAVSLVGAGIALWILAASLLGVPVWPGGPGGDSGTLHLPANPASAPHVRPAEPVTPRGSTTAVPAAAAVPRPVAQPQHRRAAAPHRTAHGPAKGVPRTATGPAPPAPAPGPSASARTSTPSGGGGGSTGGGSENPLPAATRGAAERTVGTVRQTVAPVTNVLPAPVQTPVAAAGDAVQQTAGTVDQAVDGVVTPVTGAAGQVTGGLGLGPRG